MTHSMSNFLSLVMAALLLLPRYVAAETLKIATGDGRPYIFTDGQTVDAQRPGFSIEIIQAAFEQLGWHAEFEALPFSRQISATEAGAYDAMVTMFISDAPHFIFPRKSIGIARNCFFTLAESNFFYVRAESLDGIRFGVANGYSYGAIDNYIAANKNHNVITVSGNDKEVVERMLGLLTAKRIEAFIEAEFVVEYHLAEKGLVGAVVNAGCASHLEAFIGFSPAKSESVQRAEQFDRALSQLRASGELASILQRYKVEDWRN